MIQGFLAGLLLFLAGKEFFAAGFAMGPALYALLGVWLGWLALSGSG